MDSAEDSRWGRGVVLSVSDDGTLSAGGAAVGEWFDVGVLLTSMDVLEICFGTRVIALRQWRCLFVVSKYFARALALGDVPV